MNTFSKFVNNVPAYDGTAGQKASIHDEENKAFFKGFKTVDKLSERSLSNLFQWILSWNALNPTNPIIAE